MSSERRSGNERRMTGRHSVEIEVEWEISAGRFPGTMSDVSFEGCFVLCSGKVTDGEPLRVFIPLEDGMKVLYSGVVANHTPEIGFGAKFDPLTQAQRDVIAALVKNSA
ncbi:MAG: PilZ domain-containing protein [Pyrinomonadaceae bacterium]|nr:PilZ domain-containing protein [Pyrinomonadaceae bacterium]